MDTKKLLLLINYFHFSLSIVLKEFLPRVLLMFASFLWVYLCSFIDLLGFIAKYIFRLNNYANIGENAANSGAIHSLSDDHPVQNFCKVSNSDGFEENEKEINQNRAETEDSVFKQYELISSQSKYQFLSSKDVSAFIVEPKVIKFTIGEMFVGSNDVGFPNNVKQFQPQEAFRFLDESSKYVSENLEFVRSLCYEENVERLEDTEEQPTDELITLDAESMKITNNSKQNQDFLEELISLEADGGTFEGGTVICIQEEENYDAEFIKLKSYIEDLGDDHMVNNFQENVCKFEGSCEVANIYKERQDSEENLQKFEEKSDKNLVDTDSEEDEFDILQEHKYLVKRMKMEMRYSKVKGLPTISEECESQKTLLDDLKTLDIDQKLGCKDHMAEIQLFYGSYAERMKKLDILNNQTLHAISFLHMKDSKALSGNKKSPTSLIKQYIPKLWLYKQHKIYADSLNRLASVTHQDLELVYVGQVCNSWEIISWQYEKARKLLEYDSDQMHHSSYNKVASECQQFQILLERFLEDEAFHGPRILHYVKRRCVFRTLLQTPMIKEDCLKDRKAAEVQISVSLAELADMIQQLMQVFWEFLSTEKIRSKTKSKTGTEVDKHDHAEKELLQDIRLTLQQKERRLKDILRSRNCIVKKFQKYQNDAQNHAVLTSQVELKLVSRVLCLAKISSDQLIWCRRKLDSISFLGRNVHVEHSFFLFPC